MNTIVEKISQNRLSLMSLAIALVVVYHYKCWVGGFPWYIGMIFQYGYIGVDLFFFLSGLGLAYSFQKNTTGTFYFNRVMKVLPCYLLYGAILILHLYAKGESLSVFDILYKYSTFEYTFEHKGIDWYMSALLQLYLLFPFLYYIVKVTKEWCIILIVPIVFIISWSISFHWTHLAMLQRLPVFLLGIYCMQNNKNDVRLKKIFFLYLAYFIILLLFGDKKNYEFLLTNLITPILLYLLVSCKSIFKAQRYDRMIHFRGINVLGMNTLQIYYGTNLAMLTYEYFEAPRSIMTIIFMLALIFGSYLFYWITIKSNNFLKDV